MVETENTSKVRRDLEALSSKPIHLTTLEEEAVRLGLLNIRTYSGATIEEEDRIVIALNHTRPQTNEATFVHEVIHLILSHSGYARFTFDEQYAHQHLNPVLFSKLWLLISKISSSIEHPEVYRRMTEDYDLDMEAYFKELLSQKLVRFRKARTSNLRDRIFSDQQDIIEGIEYHFYSPFVKDDLMAVFKKVSPTAYDISNNLNNELGDKWALSPETSVDAAQKILDRVIQFGETNEIGIINHLWKSIRIIRKTN